MKNKLFKYFYYEPKIKHEFYSEIPYEIKNGLILIHLNIDGSDCKFVFDTGSKSYIKNQIQKKMDLRHYFNSASTDANKIKVESEIVLGNLALGDLKVNNFKFHTKESFPFDCHNTIDGILGNDILNQGVFFFDNDAKKLIVTNSINKIDDLKEFKRLPIKINLGDIILKKNKEVFTLDSGYSYGFILTNRKSFLYNDTCESKIFMQNINALNSSRLKETIYQNGDLCLAGNKYSGIIQFTDGFDTNILGSYWFFANNIIIDIDKKVIYLKKKKIYSINQISNILNINFSFLNGNVVISGISNSISSVKLYDHVLKVNNVDLKDIHSECELQEVLKSQDKELGFNLDLKRDRDTISVFLSKEDLY